MKTPVLLAALATATLLLGCDEANESFSKAAEAQASGKWIEAAVLYAEVCTKAAESPVCPQATALAGRMHVRAGWKAIDDGQFAKAKQYLDIAAASKDRGAKRAAAAASQAPELVEGLVWEQISAIADPRLAMPKMEALADLDVPVALNARAWIEKTRPKVLLEDLRAACHQKGTGSCSEMAKQLATLHPKSAETVEGQQRLDGEYRRMHPLLKDAEGLLAQRAMLYDREQKIVACIATSVGADDYAREACEQRVPLKDATLTVSSVYGVWRQKLEEIHDPAVIRVLRERWGRAEQKGEHDPEPWPDPKG